MHAKCTIYKIFVSGSSVGIMEERVLNDLHRLLFRELLSAHVIRNNLHLTSVRKAPSKKKAKLVERLTRLDARQVIRLWPPVTVSYSKPRVSDLFQTQRKRRHRT